MNHGMIIYLYYRECACDLEYEIKREMSIPKATIVFFFLNSFSHDWKYNYDPVSRQFVLYDLTQIFILIFPRNKKLKLQ